LAEEAGWKMDNSQRLPTRRWTKSAKYRRDAVMASISKENTMDQDQHA
jgi:hypothetical protein